MNWQELRQKSLPYLEKITPYVDTAKEYSLKALDFTQKQLQNTPIVLKSITEYEVLVGMKRLILIGYDEKHPLAQELLIRAPLWSTLAWGDNATIRFYTPQGASELARHLHFDAPFDMRVYYGGNETFHAKDIEAIKAWWKDRCYDGLDREKSTPVESSASSSPIEPNEAVQDPLAHNKS